MPTGNPFEQSQPSLPGPFSRFDSLQSLFNPSGAKEDIDTAFVSATTKFFNDQAQSNPGATPVDLQRAFLQSPIFDAAQKNGVVKIPKLLGFAETMAAKFSQTSAPVAARRSEFQALGLNPFAGAIDKGTDVVGFEGRSPEVANSELGAPTENPAVDAAGQQLIEARNVHKWLSDNLKNISTDKGFSVLTQMLDREGGKFGLPALSPPKKEAGFTLSPGQTRYGPDGRPVASAAATPEASPEIVRLLDQADQARTAGQERRASLLERRAESLAGKSVDRIRAEAQASAEGAAAGGGGASRLPVNFLLPGGGTVLSTDGKTYADASGRVQALPSDAVRLGADTALTELRTERAVRDARDSLSGSAGSGTGLNVSSAAERGTGPYANVKAAFDAVAGGLGIDSLFGRNGFFKDEQQARTELRNFNQLAKTALVNNPRFPVSEQEIVQRILPDPDTFFQNPATAARNVEVLRRTLTEAKRANTESLATGALAPKEVSDIVSGNARIDRALSLMGPAVGAVPEGVPEGSRQVGTTRDGKPVYETQDGQRLVVE